ncbi:MAG: peptidase S9, prolyl oligopeptidase [Blastocatellia bacterium AA13]|nr:MAG: peptidase S9, prolyl oligopeptidase [Blastocatellia bacterium AA13]
MRTLAVSNTCRGILLRKLLEYIHPMKKVVCILAALLVFESVVRGQDADSGVIVPSDNLVVDGIPKIPASLLKTISRYTGAFGFRLAGWDAASGEILLKNLAGSETWILHAGKAGGSPKLSLLIPTGVYDLYYQPQQKYFVYDRDVDGNDAFQLYLFDLATRKSTILTDGKSRNTEPVWSHAGERIIFSSSPPNGNGVDLSLINPFDPKTARVLATGNGNYLKAYDWSPDDRKAVFCEFTSNTTSSLWVIDVGAAERTLLSVKGDSSDYYESPQFSKDGAGIYVITDRESEFRRVAYISLASKRITFLSSHIDGDVEDYSLSPDGKTIAFATNENGISRLRLLDAKTGKERPAPQPPKGIVSNFEWSGNSVDLAFNFRSALTPNDVYSLNIESSKLEQRYHGFTGSVDLGKLPEPQSVTWKSFDGRIITGFLHRPPASFSGKRPVLIDIHGGPEEQYRPEFGYYHNYFLNELGIAEIFPNVRGSTGYGKSFHRLDDRMLRADACKDIGALLDWVKTQPDLDADRVIIRGASYGGYLSLSAAVSYGDRIRAAISDSGPSSLISFIENTAGWRRDIQRHEYGDERDPKIREFMERTAPVNSAGKIKKPLLIIQGQNDPRVPAGEAQQMLTAIKTNKTSAWYLLAKNEGHDWKKRANQEFRLCAMALFVEEYLLRSSK